MSGIHSVLTGICRVIQANITIYKAIQGTIESVLCTGFRDRTPIMDNQMDTTWDM